MADSNQTDNQEELDRLEERLRTEAAEAEQDRMIIDNRSIYTIRDTILNQQKHEPEN